MCNPTGENGMFDFGEALRLLKLGNRVKRAGWNGQGIFVSMSTPDSGDSMTQPFLYIDTLNLQTKNPMAPKGRVPWAPSQTDILAEDWILL